METTFKNLIEIIDRMQNNVLLWKSVMTFFKVQQSKTFKIATCELKVAYVMQSRHLIFKLTTCKSPWSRYDIYLTSPCELSNIISTFKCSIWSIKLQCQHSQIISSKYFKIFMHNDGNLIKGVVVFIFL